MMIGNMIDYDLSGFYDNGGVYEISLSVKNDFYYKTIEKELKNNKKFKIKYYEDDLRIILSSNNLKISFDFLKHYCLNLSLKTL